MATSGMEAIDERRAPVRATIEGDAEIPARAQGVEHSLLGRADGSSTFTYLSPGSGARLREAGYVRSVVPRGGRAEFQGTQIHRKLRKSTRKHFSHSPTFVISIDRPLRCRRPQHNGGFPSEKLCRPQNPKWLRRFSTPPQIAG